MVKIKQQYSSYKYPKHMKCRYYWFIKLIYKKIILRTKNIKKLFFPLIILDISIFIFKLSNIMNNETIFFNFKLANFKFIVLLNYLTHSVEKDYSMIRIKIMFI